MKCKMLFLVTAMLALASVVQGQSIVVVNENFEPGHTSLDAGLDDYVTFIQGVFSNATITQGFYDDVLNNPAELALLESADLIIVCRHTNSGDYDDSPEEIAAWNGFTAPMLLSGAHNSRSSRWRWFNSTSIPADHFGNDVDVIDSSDPIFDGVTITGENATVWSGGTGEGVDYIGTSEVGNGTLVAKPDGVATGILIARFEAGVEFYTGSGQIPGGERVFFGMKRNNTFNDMSANGRLMLENALRSLLAPAAINPVPADGAINVPIETDLTWDDPDDPKAPTFVYDVYFGDDPNLPANPKVVSNADVNTYIIPGDLALDTTYYWQIDTIDPNGFVVLASLNLSFTTVPPEPVITQQPLDQFPFSGGSATFTVAATSVSDGPFYQWYQTGDPNVLLTGETDPTLTIDPATVADIGGYFCRVSNNNGHTDSDVAQLDSKRCLYHWPLDGDAVEANGTGYDGVLESSDPNNLVNLPTFTTGRIGQAISLDDALGQQIRVAEPPISITGEMSVACWVNPANVSKDWAGILSKWSSDNSARSFWVGQLNTDGGVRFGIYPAGPTAETSANSVDGAHPLADGEWTYLVGTYDGAEARVYANGELVGITTLTSSFVDRVGDLVMGRVATSNYYPGLIDDVKIYNYGLTQAEVATAYNAVTGETVCVRDANSLTTSPLVPRDINEDCIVDLLDFLRITQRWLDTALLP